MAAEVQGKYAIPPDVTMKDSAIQTDIVALRDDRAYETLLVRKIDRRLLPILGALYAISLIDRVNISNARVAGMNDDLGLGTGNRYSITLVVFFIPYFLFELPSNLILRRVGAANWLGFIGFAWGTVMLGQGFVKNYQELAVCRTILGLFEAGFFPGCVYLVSCWYVRYELQKRLAWFYLLSVLAGGFSSILAYGLLQMNGLGGLRGWRWVFIIDGLLTQAIAIAAWFIIIDFPDKAHLKSRFISKDDADLINERINRDRGDATPDLPQTWSNLGGHFVDWKLYAFAVMFMCTTMPAYAFFYFSPEIIQSFGYGPGVSNLLAAPPVITAVISALIFAYLGDKYRLRAPFIAIQGIMVIIGLMITAYHKKFSLRYFGIFLGQAGCQGNIPATLAYHSNNIRRQSKRAVASALQIGFGAIGGIVASTTFRERDAPKYLAGFWVTASLQFTILLILGVMTPYFYLQNKKESEGTLEEPIEGQPGFRYTL